MQILVAVGAAPLQQHIAQLADDVFALALDDDVKLAVIKGFFGQGAHLGAAADGDDFGVVLLGLPRHLIRPRRLVDQRGEHQDVDAL